MMKRPLQFAINACRGHPIGVDGDIIFEGVSTDTRQLQPGILFIALRGENFDGNQFAEAALTAGAVAVIVDGKTAAAPRIEVSDGRAALGALAVAHRAEFDLPLFAIAGSNGKTSTKEMLAAILRAQFETLHSPASFNNDIGVPSTLLQLEPRHEAAVLELGTNHSGELAPLVQMAAPRFGLLTGIGREHLEHFGDLAGVEREEGMLAELLPASGKLFLNGDGDWREVMVNRTPASTVTIGVSAGNDWQVCKVQVDAEGTSFELGAANPAFGGEYRTPLMGAHQAVNAALAIAAATELGMARDVIAQGLASAEVPGMRLQWVERDGVRWLNDAYNANADSVAAALETLAGLAVDGRKFVVLGDMAELGDQTAAAHREAGEHAAGVVDGLIAVGDKSETTATAAEKVGLRKVCAVTDVDAAAEELRGWLDEDDVVLLKASRAARLERLMDLV